MKKKPSEGNDAGLASLRAEIDKCDAQIIRLLARRFRLVRKVGEYKAIHNLPVFDEVRENQLLSDRKRQAGENYSIEEIFKVILEQSRRIQMKVREELNLRKIESKQGE
jgi:chorismate mutase